ncbi:hypothetical protein PCAR4_340121 [Paraburkholderia caribensis]|uniref:Uncharacterized protein n=1 Tax=Paraburkholderia largidicola TaxID=3014751 RepID=A0A7I8BM46_9BURK|nr:hypothetical protein PPGU16_23480 [Paraburkholderia sp. PGU16]CAG9253243.1 hypothetical protein PCAR4_340121 [Paraburkholderia caribensis]
MGYKLAASHDGYARAGMAGGGATVRGSIRKAEIRHGKTLMRGKSLAFNTHWPATDTSRGAPCGLHLRPAQSCCAGRRQQASELSSFWTARHYYNLCDRNNR